MNATRRVFIKTYGCQMNVYDSNNMADVLGAVGYGATDTPEDADLILLNTCHIREKAAEKVYSEIGRLKAIKRRGQRRGRRVQIAVAGCVAQAEGAEILRRAEAVDVVVGPQSYHRLPELLSSGERVVETEFPAESKFDFLPASTRGNGSAAPGRQTSENAPVSAFLTIQEGCDKFCTFCVVPYTRGAEFSRPVAKILEEAKALAARGVREITLLGQNVNAYHGAGPDGRDYDLATLSTTLSEIPEIRRIRYTTSHPRDVGESQIAAHRDNPKLMPYLHLPVQAGSDRVLAAMNRKHDRGFYLRLVEKIRKARPDLALSGDFIVGFPGETEEDFLDTLRLVEEVEYASAFSFKYSVRPGTPAAEMEQVPEEEKSERLQRLQALITKQQAAFNAKMRGLVVDVLFERAGKYPGQLVGKSPWLQAVQVTAPREMIGEIVPVTIDSIGSNSLFGTLMNGEEDVRAIA